MKTRLCCWQCHTVSYASIVCTIDYKLGPLFKRERERKRGIERERERVRGREREREKERERAREREDIYFTSSDIMYDNSLNTFCKACWYILID